MSLRVLGAGSHGRDARQLGANLNAFINVLLGVWVQVGSGSRCPGPPDEESDCGREVMFLS